MSKISILVVLVVFGSISCVGSCLLRFCDNENGFFYILEILFIFYSLKIIKIFIFLYLYFRFLDIG